MFETFSPASSDALMQVMKLFRSDPRSDKIDLGIGTYRDDEGRTPVLSVVKRAEEMLLLSQDTKTYLGPDGDAEFTACLQSLILPSSLAHDSRVAGVQTPGGTGAVRLALELVRLAKPNATVFLGLPTWPNHEPIIRTVGLRLVAYQHAAATSQSFSSDEMFSTISGGKPDDVVLLHGCCHNPTGLDLSIEQWRELSGIVQRRRLIPLFDLAYQGMGRGLVHDVEGMHLILRGAEEALIAVSCSKTFGLYRERTGALLALGAAEAAAARAREHLMKLARVTYSMPPDHGAAVVRTILASSDLASDWRRELAEMRTRVSRVRAELHSVASSKNLSLASLESGHGMFAMIGVSPSQIATLRNDGIYMADTGRINIAGLRAGDPERLVDALLKVGKGGTQ